MARPYVTTRLDVMYEYEHKLRINNGVFALQCKSLKRNGVKWVVMNIFFSKIIILLLLHDYLC